MQVGKGHPCEKVLPFSRVISIWIDLVSRSLSCLKCWNYTRRRNSVGTTLVEVPTLPNYKRVVHWTTCILHQYFTKYKLSEYVIVRIYHSRGKTQYFRYLPYSYRAEVRATVETHYCKPIKRNIDARKKFCFPRVKKAPPSSHKKCFEFFLNINLPQSNFIRNSGVLSILYSHSRNNFNNPSLPSPLLPFPSLPPPLPLIPPAITFCAFCGEI